MKYNNIAVIAAKKNNKAALKKKLLIKRYGFKDLTNNSHDIEGIDLVVALGGDGLMLHLLHEYEKNILPIYGINCGTIGFLMNSWSEEKLLEKIQKAKESIIHPLRMEAIDVKNNKYEKIAINEVSLLRQTSQAAKINVKINSKLRLKSLAADGILVATSAGSTAYNLSLRGPIIPFNSNILALTPISPFRPRNWRGALLASDSEIEFEIIDPLRRPVSATADYNEVRNVKKVIVKEDLTIEFKILFDANHSLEERISKEQFN
jgi:NAD+ kinase